MVKNRLEWYVERHCIINKSQGGFRRGKGVFDNLAILTSRILSSLSENQLLVIILLDISSAYDNINVDLLISELAKLGIPKDMSLLIKDLLTDRRIQVKDPSTKNGSYQQGCSTGFPALSVAF